jgi:hypothetical protein
MQLNKVINRANGFLPNSAHPLLTTAMPDSLFDKAVIQERNWELVFGELRPVGSISAGREY